MSQNFKKKKTEALVKTQGLMIEILRETIKFKNNHFLEREKDEALREANRQKEERENELKKMRLLEGQKEALESEKTRLLEEQKEASSKEQRRLL